MPQLAVSAVGRDRPGIVAAVAGTLLEHGLNVSDSRMAILHGHFAMMLIAEAAKAPDVDAVREGLERVRDELGLEAIAVREVAELPGEEPGSEATHIVSVYGADHPGIVHAVTRALADAGANVTDLSTRLLEGGDEPALYVMLVEAVVPDEAGLERALAAVGRDQGVDVTVRPLEHDAL